MQGNDLKTEEDTAKDVKWECRKHNVEIKGDKPECPSPKVHCKYRTSCLVYYNSMLDD